MVPSILDAEVSAACHYCQGLASGGYTGLKGLQEAEDLADRLAREGAALKRLRTCSKTLSGEILLQALLHLSDAHGDAREAGHSGRALALACYTLAEIVRERPQTMARMFLYTDMAAGTIRAAHGSCLVSAVLAEVGPRPKASPHAQRRRGRRMGPPPQPSLVDLWDAAQERRRQEERE
jgi:hypothetical protein